MALPKICRRAAQAGISLPGMQKARLARGPARQFSPAPVATSSNASPRDYTLPEPSPELDFYPDMIDPLPDERGKLPEELDGMRAGAAGFYEDWDFKFSLHHINLQTGHSYVLLWYTKDAGRTGLPLYAGKHAHLGTNTLEASYQMRLLCQRQVWWLANDLGYDPNNIFRTSLIVPRVDPVRETVDWSYPGFGRCLPVIPGNFFGDEAAYQRFQTIRPRWETLFNSTGQDIKPEPRPDDIMSAVRASCGSLAHKPD